MGKDKYADKAAARSHSSEKNHYDGAAPVKEKVKAEEPKNTPGAPEVEEPKAEVVAEPEEKKGKAKGREHIEAYLKAASSRRKDLPKDLLEKAGQARTKNDAKRLVRDHLRAVGAA